jgi:CspA family cold shock protein
MSIEESEMVTGTVKFFNGTKNFGFITGDDGKDYFVHATGLKPGVSITEGDKVSFEVVAGDKGPKADKVDKAP